MAKKTKPAALRGKLPHDLAPDALASVYRIVHDIPGRMRLRPLMAPAGRAEAAEMVLALCPGLSPGEVAVSPSTGSILILYTAPAARAELARAFTPKPEPARRALPGRGAEEALPPAPPAPLEDPGVPNPIPHKLFSMAMPYAYRAAFALWSSLGYLWRGARAIASGKLNLDALDGAAMAVCILQRDFRTLGAITFFFALGDFLADWTRKRSRASLADSLALKIDRVWVRAQTPEGDLERQIPLREVRVDDLVMVNAGSIIPVDGTVAEGEGMVNQSAMTGEPLAVFRGEGASLYAGTVLEEGHLLVKAAKVGGDTRISAILNTIEESEAAKAGIQSRYEHLADAVVPYNFLLAGLVYALTGNAARAGSVLLVDYSCAIRLATPLSIFTGMRQAAEHGVLIKGGKFMEAVAEADVLVFDKTGTLTQARPRLLEVLAFDGHAEDDVLRLAACLEEHFVHPVGQAVVRAADERKLKHREEHTRVDYVVAHGIASFWNSKRVLIGSEHFVLEDEKIPLDGARQAEVERRTSGGLSALYLAMDGQVIGVLFIEDTIREDAAAVVAALKADGIKRVIMLTGDATATAAGIAAKAGIDEFHARMLPEEKARFIASLKAEGHKVIMIGDGINDSPALSAADVGVAMAEGADMAREIADIVLTGGELSGILLARGLSRAALSRVRRNFVASVALNSVFLMGGLAGLLTAGVSALLHNATTAGIALRSLSALPEAGVPLRAGQALPPEKQKKRGNK